MCIVENFTNLYPSINKCSIAVAPNLVCWAKEFAFGIVSCSSGPVCLLYQSEKKMADISEPNFGQKYISVVTQVFIHNFCFYSKACC